MGRTVSPPFCDYLLFFATPTESKALSSAAKARNLPFQKATSQFGTFYDLGELGTSRVVAVQTEVGALGPKGAISSAHYYLATTQASGIVSVGMAFGLSRELQPMGTVLVSEKLFAYDDRIVRADTLGPFTYAYDAKKFAVPCQPELLRIFRDHQSWRNANTVGFAVQFGVFLAGSAKIECTAYRELLVRSCRHFGPLVGGEMEGVALLTLAKPSGGIVVKGISDFAEDGQPQEVRANRQAACDNAVGFVLDALLAWNPARNAV